MKELVARSGINRETIRYYINEGLLPEGAKTARNMAWYGEEHVQRLQLIRKLQQEHFLPLKAIRTLLEESSDFHFSPAQNQVLAAVRRHLHTGKAPAAGVREVEEVCAELGLERAEVDALQRSGHLELDRVGQQQYLGPADVELLRSWAELRQSGLTAERGFGVEDLEALTTVTNIMLRQEAHVFEERLRDMSPEEGLAMFVRAIPAINRIFAVLHERELRRFLDEYFRGPQGTPEES
jgi:DNA-binding transcriptional MerR regulator